MAIDEFDSALTLNSNYGKVNMNQGVSDVKSGNDELASKTSQKAAILSLWGYSISRFNG
jgi:hypothetical protein